MIAAKIALLVVVVGVVVGSEPGKLKCQNDVKYRENLCNECKCLEEGTDRISCSRRLCGTQAGATLRNCKEDTAWTDEHGEQCWCVHDFGTVCTYK